jgi:hypothetical protein
MLRLTTCVESSQVYLLSGSVVRLPTHTAVRCCVTEPLYYPTRPAGSRGLRWSGVPGSVRFSPALTSRWSAFGAMPRMFARYWSF